MKIVVISNCNPGSAFVIRALSAHVDIIQIIKPVWSAPTTRGTSRKIKTLLRNPFRACWNRVNEMYRTKVSNSLQEDLSLKLGTSEKSLDGLVVKECATNLINSDEVMNGIVALQPDMIFLCGAPIIKAKYLNILPPAVNLHLGIAPDYRGEHTLLWPWLNGEHHLLGITVHYAEPKVDSGPVLARGFIESDIELTEASLFEKAYRLAAQVLDEFFLSAKVHGLIPGQALTGNQGKLILYRDRTLLTWFRQAFLRKPLRQQKHSRERDIEKYFPCPHLSPGQTQMNPALEQAKS